MKPPLSNLDYLIKSRPAEESNPQAAPPNSAVDEAAVALGGPILQKLYRAPDGKQRVYDFVDSLDVNLENLLPVLEILSRRYEWVDVDRSDRHGNYEVTLTPRGRNYLEKTMGAKAV